MSILPDAVFPKVFPFEVCVVRFAIAHFLALQNHVHGEQEILNRRCKSEWDHGVHEGSTELCCGLDEEKQTAVEFDLRVNTKGTTAVPVPITPRKRGFRIKEDIWETLHETKV